MKNVRKIYILIILIMTIMLGLMILFVFKRNSTNENYLIEKVITNYGLMLNKTEYYVPINSKINLEIDNPNNVEYKINIINSEVVNIENNEVIAKNIGYTDFTIEIIVKSFQKAIMKFHKTPNSRGERSALR